MICDGKADIYLKKLMVMDEKIAKLYQNLKTEGVDDIRANDIIQKVKER